MKGIYLNKLHRYVGIVIAPFLVIQTITGLLLSFSLIRRAGSTMPDQGLNMVSGYWNEIFAKTHFGPGVIGDAYHLLLGAGIIWMSASGWILYLRGRRLRKSVIR